MNFLRVLVDQAVDALLVADGAERVVTSACVSPRWNRAEPCVRGSTPTSQ